MTPERWARIKDLFEDASERSLEDRFTFLAEACSDDHTLRDEVLRLLVEHDQAHSFLEEPLFPAFGTLCEHSALQNFAPGEIISGRYKIVQFIAEGGMGRVYEAED